MTQLKRIIPVSEVEVGDSIQVGGVRGPLFVTEIWRKADYPGTDRVSVMTPTGSTIRLNMNPLTDVNVGYTNRKAKRARGKMARRERLRDDASFRRLVSRALRTIPAIRLANELAVSRSTVIRWANGASVPHAVMCEPVRSAIARMRAVTDAEVLA